MEHSHAANGHPSKAPGAREFERILWLIINTADSHSDTRSGLEQTSSRNQLDVELVAIAGFQGLGIGVFVNGLPGFRLFQVELTVRRFQPALGDKMLLAVGIDLQQ